jgi:hypothetical protein
MAVVEKPGCMTERRASVHSLQFTGWPPEGRSHFWREGHLWQQGLKSLGENNGERVDNYSLEHRLPSFLSA